MFTQKLLAFSLIGVVVADSNNNTFSGIYVDGEATDADGVNMLQLLDVSARQTVSTSEVEYQTLLSLYRGDWDGLTEGPTWQAWWTQNSYGPAITAFPFLQSTAWHAWQQSMAWWFNSIGDGTKTGRNANVPAPDGCLCDAALPCGPAGDCTYYKQGDGNVPRHDWTFEETLSALVMQAEQLLISRNVTGIHHFLPLFMRTSEMLENRRDPATSYKTFLTGPSSNLLAPSFGGAEEGSGFGGWAYLTGVSVTYTAALSRMYECAMLVGNTSIAAIIQARKTMTLDGLELLLSPTKDYFVRSRDPSGVLHGVLNQSKYGYFEVSPNTDAVALRVVDDEMAEKIMAKIDSLDAEIRPNVFLLPNSDAGGGVGYDDMLCGTGKTCGGIFEYGVWVNGGVWTTVEARAILAYFRTNRQSRAAKSMAQMLNLFVSSWRMDAPLKDFGKSVYEDLDINLTIDAFGPATALLRGLFEYLYTAASLTIIPHVPDNIASMTQKFGVRWGSYRLFLSTAGNASLGIKSVTVNGVPVTSFNKTTITLSYQDMPSPSPRAREATDSDVLTASDTVTVNIIFNSNSQPFPVKRQPSLEGVPSSSPTVWLKAEDLKGIQPGDNVTAWSNPGYPTVSDSKCVYSNRPPTFTGTAVRFDGEGSCLGGNASLGEDMTVFAVIVDLGSPASYSPVLNSHGADKGLDVNPTMCSSGWPTGPDACNSTNARVISIDYSGSSDDGSWINISHKLVVAAVNYKQGFANSEVSGCAQSDIAVPSSGVSPTIYIGSRGDPPSYNRYFKGDLYELLVYNRSLTDEEMEQTRSYLFLKYNTSNISCNKPAPDLECETLAANGLTGDELGNLTTFITKLTTANLSDTLPYNMAEDAIAYNNGGHLRCAQLSNGTLPALRSVGANTASVTLLFQTAKQIFTGMANLLHRYDSTSQDPIAQEIVKIWNSTQS
eukprot:m.307959 g.307959  ORF g.307959 m.307959 type:complete len:943 (-) comp16467_c0_seq2:162-2990(-)